MAISKDTIHFLHGLAANNDRVWFQLHKADYLLAKANFESVVGEVLEGLQSTNPQLEGLEVRDCVYRIYRDVRFSKNKSPYKPHFAASFNRGGRMAAYPGYYLHVQPGGESFLGGGLYRPSASVLKIVRQEIDYNFKDFEAILAEPGFRFAFDGLWPDVLKTVPRGYDKDNQAIEYLKHKSYIVSYPLSDEVIDSKGFVEYVVSVFNRMKSFIMFLETPLLDEDLQAKLEKLDA